MGWDVMGCPLEGDIGVKLKESINSVTNSNTNCCIYQESSNLEKRERSGS